jgi:outer membrane protein assembly factor BamA
MRLFRVFCALLALAVTPALAQYTVKKIVFDGKTPYTPEALEAASGLKSGDHITPETMQQAGQRLSDTGAFDDLQVTLDGPVKAISVIFKIKPAPPEKMIAVDFENFIWWKPEELATELHKRVPLFGALIPEAGSLQQSVQDALQQMLAEKQITATLSSHITDPTPGEPLRIVHYRIKSPDIRIRSFKLDNVAPAQSEQMTKITSALAGSLYKEGSTGRGFTDSILTVYRNAGYLEASIEDLNSVITQSAPNRIDIDLSASMKPGDLYHVANILWAGSPLISEKEFADGSKIHPGDLTSQQNLRASLALIDTAYRRQGYMDVSVDANPQLDTAGHLVTYTVVVNSGPQYHLNEIEVLNLSPDARTKFDAAWKLKPGDLYDSTYLTAFFKANIAQPYLAPYSLAYRTERDPDTHLVKLIFVFAKAGK